jgi:CrcB protein
MTPAMNPYLLVGIGGALGAMARLAIGGLVGALPNGFPLSTFLINIAGSLAMGLLVGVLAKTTPQFQNEIRLFVAVGVFGGFTTFSSFSLDAISMIERGDMLLAAAYVVGSVLFGIAGLWIGMQAMRVVL